MLPPVSSCSGLPTLCLFSQWAPDFLFDVWLTRESPQGKEALPSRAAFAQFLCACSSPVCFQAFVSYILRTFHKAEGFVITGSGNSTFFIFESTIRIIYSKSELLKQTSIQN